MVLAVRGHPGHVDVDRLDALDAAQAVAVQHRAFEQVDDGCEPDVRMRPHVVAVAGTGANRSEVVLPAGACSAAIPMVTRIIGRHVC